MADWSPFPIIDGAYSDDALPWSAQDTVNWLPVRTEVAGTRSEWKLSSPPGLVAFCDTGTNAPVRGTHDVEGKLLAVAGTTLFNITTAGVAEPLGTIPGVDRVTMAHNQIINGNEVAIANGQSGYVYNTITNTLVQITDDGFAGFRSVDFIDGFVAGVEPQGRFWAHSDLADATSYNTLSRYEAETAPDKMVTLKVSHREVLVLGERSGEFYRNAGGINGATFQRSEGTEMDVGTLSTFGIERRDNSLCWLGNDGLVYQLSGHSPQIISTGPIASAIADLDLASAFAMAWEDRGHKVFYLTFPQGQTFGHDAWTGKWHRRESFGLERWRVNTLTRSNGTWYGGDYANGKIYRLDWETMTEDGAPMVSRRRSGVLHASGHPLTVAGVKLGFDVGRVPVGVTDHHCNIRYSDDGGHNFSEARICSLGAAGQYRITVDERRWGRADYRVWEIEVSSPAKRDLIDAMLMVERGQA